MAQKKVEDILEKMALKYDLPIQVIEQVFMSQWKAVKDNIRSLEFKTIKLPAWGKYIPSQKKLRVIDYSKKRELIELKKNKLNGTGETKDS